MQIIDYKGKKTAVINTLIDGQNGFSRFGIPDDQGGSLGVPRGQESTTAMGQIIKESRDTTFVISQDYHPDNHISFLVNHPGVMEYRMQKFQEFLHEHDQPQPATREELYERAQQPAHFFNGMENPPELFPFPEIVLSAKGEIMGLKEADGRIRTVKVEPDHDRELGPNDRGRVKHVLDEYLPKTFDEYRKDGDLISTQTLWTKHCVQSTESCLFPPEMNLPAGLIKLLKGDAKSDIIRFHDKETGNDFHIVRKGDKSEVDSYGIGVENDGETETAAKGLFRQMAKDMKAAGVEQVVFNVGGLASNFCVEFSANNIDDFLKGHFRQRGIKAEINYVPEMSRGIPIPGGPEVPFSENGVAGRLADRGIGEKTVSEVIALSAPKASGLRQGFPRPGGPSVPA
jgi:hypothetical protein